VTTPHSPADTGPAASGQVAGEPRPQRRTRALAATAAAAVLATGAYLLGDHAASARALEERRAQVAARGATVMPFDLDRTSHVFEPTEEGGRQTVTADDPADTAQVGLIRGHLEQARAAFARGDFTDPAAIHGQDMPGLAALQAGHRRFDITYTDVPGGARLTYTTADPALVEALHAWYRAQVSDHGSHAESGHP